MVLSDITVSVILCLTVALAYRTVQYQKLQAAHQVLQDKIRACPTCTPTPVVAAAPAAQSSPADDAGLTAQEREARKWIQDTRQSIEERLRGAAQYRMVFGTDSLVVRFQNDVLFSLGRAELQARGKVVLRKFADSIRPVVETADLNTGKGRVLEIQIQGHTDLSGSYADNWALSRSRAESVRDFWIQNKLLPAHLLSVAAYNYHRPIRDYPTKNPQDRRAEVAENRRVDVRIIFHRADKDEQDPLTILPLGNDGRRH
ncbi:MAG: OmpA family protein [Fimbriimonadaceae bacterium]|nr:OmpA family protein [Fimbriimonadaceae bacterium]